MQPSKETEQQIILELSRFLNPNAEKLTDYFAEVLDYPYLLGNILHHRMGAVCYYVLKQNALLGKVHREFRNTLKIIYESHRVQAVSMLEALSLLGKILSGIAVPYAVLKGGFLVDLYPHGLRTSNDIDILVDQKDLAALTSRLKENGFEQGTVRDGQFVAASRTEIVSSRMNRGETVPYIRQIGLPQMEYMEIDVNFSLDFKARQESDTVPRLLSRTQPLIHTDFGTLQTLCPTDFMIHLCLHLYKEATVSSWVKMNRDQSLYKYCDIYLLIHEWMDFQYANMLAQEIKLCAVERECYYALAGTKALFDIHNEALDWLLDGIRPNNMDFLSEISDPQANETYFHNQSFVQWVFCPNRIQQLTRKA